MGYVANRIGQGVVVIWAAFTLSFILLYLLPSDPVAIMLNQGADAQAIDPEAIERLRARHGLDRGPFGQYLFALQKALGADFGQSIALGRPVTALLAEALPQTALLALTAGAIAALLGVGLALATAMTGSPVLRRILSNIPAVTVSMPGFWVGILLIQIFSFQLRLLPAIGNTGWQSLVLPALTLSLPTAAVVAQVLYANLHETMAQPFVDILRAKGVSERRIMLSHVLRVAGIPALTLISMNVATMLAGAIVVETVFSRSGIGRLTESAVRAQDIPVVQGIVVLSAVIFVIANLLADLVYPLIDPRIAAAIKAKD